MIDRERAEAAINDVYPGCSTHWTGSGKCAVVDVGSAGASLRYDDLQRLSMLLHTTLIDVNATYEDSGCDTCGGWGTHELVIRWPE
ncbi:MAG: hypothetical protein ACYTEQ_18225 [Planctomycetota bacterium]